MLPVLKDIKNRDCHLTLNACNGIQLQWILFKQVRTKTSIILLKVIAGSIFIMNSIELISMRALFNNKNITSILTDNQIDFLIASHIKINYCNSLYNIYS